MTEVLVYGALFGAGLLMVLAAQPYGAPRASLARRLAALRPEIVPGRRGKKEQVFRTRLFEEGLRPSLERAGDAIAGLLGRLGLDLRTTEARLRASGDHGGLALFLGQKLAAGLIGFAFLPVAESFGLAPRTPVWLWVTAAAGGFLLPDAILKSRAEARRRRMREDLVHVVELLALSVSSGVGIEGAVEQATSSGEGPLFHELRRLLRETHLRGEPSSDAFLRLPDEAGLPDAESLAAAVRSAIAHGAPVTQALRAQAQALRERQRLELVEAGERAQVRMLLPTGLLILPAFFLVVLYPAAVQLLKVTGP
ncbi:MAG TPA: type II secretion system F family protein [Actinomycetota bacterium]|nr:type II secretion system F family protein [Actinomycetota bacterium]